MPSQSGRELWVREGLDDTDAPPYSSGHGRLRYADTVEEANLVSSHASGKEGTHRPAIDIDMPCRLVETSPGKFHLYIDTDISWDAYRGLLHALVAAGIVEPGFVSVAEKNGATFLRLFPERKPR